MKRPSAYPARPRPEPTRRKTGHIGRGGLLALLLHAGLCVPLIVAALWLGAAEQRRREEREARLAAERQAEEGVDVEWKSIDPELLPDDLPALDKLPERAKPEPKPEEPPEPETPTPEEKKPEPEAAPTPPPPPPQQRLHEKMVDLDMEKDVEPPPDAKYLAQKNNRAEIETRATETNLEKARAGEQPASEKSDVKEGTPGEAEDKIAQLLEQQSELGRQAPAVTPENDPKPAATPRPDPRSILTLRPTETRPHEVTPETANPSLPHEEDGLAQLPDPGQARANPTPRTAGPASAPGDLGPATPPRLRLSEKDLEAMYGKELDAARLLAQKEKSRHKGRFSRALELGRMALENFIPEVQPGNQTALNTRAAPFAAYLAAMHRNIHELWGFGFLSDLGSRAQSNAMNNPDLWTRLEIVLAGDGTVDNVKIIRSSGVLPFDVAAMDVIHSAGPYPEPPSEIRSGNGKIYLHWSFHRDERQCATFGADYFILDNAGAGADGATLEPGATRPAVPHVHRPGDTHPAPPRALENLARGGGGEGAARAMPAPEDAAAARRADREIPHADDPLARTVARAFFAAYQEGNVGGMVKEAAYPFRADGAVAAQTAAELRTGLSALVAESKRRRAHSVNVYSAAALRAATGFSPPGTAEDHRLLYAVGVMGGETFIATLTPRFGGWKVAALTRR